MERSDEAEPIISGGTVRRFTPMRVAAVYLAFGLLWIWVSDHVLTSVNLPGRLEFWIAGAKGTFYIFLSTIFVYFVVRREFRGVSQLATLLKAVADGTTDAIFVKDRQGRYLLFNQAAAEFVDRPVSEVLGRDDRDLFDEASASVIRKRDARIMQSGVAETEEEILTAKGVTRTYLATKAPFRDHEGIVIGLIGVSRDITERKRLEEQYRQAQKMEAIGQLAGGVAHDFNNLLTIINGYSELLFESLPEGRQRDLVEQIWKAGERSASLTRQLLAFSRKHIWAPVVLDLHEVIVETETMLRRVIGEDIELVTELEANDTTIKVDPSQMQQVLLNLSVNARDAMPQGGTLRIATRNHALTEKDMGAHRGGRPGGFILLEVADSGSGIAPDIANRIFEPFFTTKPPGSGTGLGLAVVHGVVKQAEGFVEVSSPAGCGTTFRIYFPISDGVHQPSTTIPKPPGAGNKETILLVEDEASLRELVHKVLLDNGYQVLQADGSESAIAQAMELDGKVDLLVTDVIMPGMGGRSLAELLAKQHSEMKVLFISGYTDDLVMRHGIAGESVHFLQKPFSPTALLAKIREVLGTPSTPKP